MLTDEGIQDLIALPKRITSKAPANGYREQGNHIRCDLELEAVVPNDSDFTIFIRRHTRFIENYSIGLRYRTDDRALGNITLVRYNGPHGENSRDPDGHYARPHIHFLTEAELVSGSIQPQESQREVTNRFSTYEQALRVFFSDIATQNHNDYFPELIQLRLLDGC